MQPLLQTIILRHNRENLKKCSLRGLESRKDIDFYTYPKATLPSLSGYIQLAIGAPELSKQDAHKGLFLIDGTWRYAQKMQQAVGPQVGMELRSLPKTFRTAYPRRQLDCPEPEFGLASVEALYIAYFILGWDTTGLLDFYHWHEEFLCKNIDFAMNFQV